MTRRPGLSLTEVLVALFIMGIGAVAVLTLFPLGALNMAQALRDDRTTQAATQAGAYLRWYWQDAYDRKLTGSPPNQLEAEAFFTAMDSLGVTGTIPIGTGETTPSYSVVIDPMGFEARFGRASQSWLGESGQGKGLNQSNLARRSLNTITNSTLYKQSLAQRTCSLLDGLTYDPATGIPPAAGVERDMRYNWLWVIRRPSNKQRTTIDATVVVFDRRAHMFTAPAGETAHAATAATLGQSLVSFATADMPIVQKGSWLLDATVTTFDYLNQVYVPPDAPGPPPVGQPAPRAGVRNANFYRVVSVTQTGTGVDVELDPPLAFTDNGGDPAVVIQPGHRRFIALSGVAEVFVLKESVIAK